MKAGTCPPWCTGEDLDGIHEGRDVAAGQAVQIVDGMASEIPFQTWVTPMLEDASPWVVLHDGETGAHGLGLDLQPDDARNLARALVEAADLVDPPKE